MHRNPYLSLLGFTVFACSILAASTSHATSIGFNVSLQTSPLIGNSAGPFFIDFQLNDGSGTGDANNNVMIDNFVFGGGSAVDGPLLTIGGATGNLSSSVSITDSEFLNEFTQQFDPGSMLNFRVNLTTNVDSGPTPDAFSFSILDSTLTPFPTTGLGDALLLVNINSENPLIETFPTSEGSTIQLSAPVITSVPETGSSISMLLMGIGAVWCLLASLRVSSLVRELVP
jgi:hypothetical protein